MQCSNYILLHPIRASRKPTTYGADIVTKASYGTATNNRHN